MAVTLSPGVATTLAADNLPPASSPVSAWLVGRAEAAAGGGTCLLGSVRANAGAGLNEDAGAAVRGRY